MSSGNRIGNKIKTIDSNNSIQCSPSIDSSSRKNKPERSAVINFRVNERGSNSRSSPYNCDQSSCDNDVDHDLKTKKMCRSKKIVIEDDSKFTILNQQLKE